MKQLLLSASLILLAGSVATASTANVYASQIKANGSVVSMILNDDANEVIIEVLGGDGEVVGSTNLGEGKKGFNLFAVNIPEVESGTYSYRITCKGDAVVGEPVQVSTKGDALLEIANSRGIAIDNNPSSPYFGRIYVTSIQANGKTGSRMGTGIYILGADCSDISGQGSTPYAGGESWSGNSSPYRLTVAPNGDVYVCDWSDIHSGVWVMDPAAPESNWRAVFGGSRNGVGLASENGVGIHGSIPGLFVTGTGAETKLYTLDEDYEGSEDPAAWYMLRYDIGEQTEAWAFAPSREYAVDKNYLKYGNQDIAYDGRGGAWITQQDEKSAPSYAIHINLESGKVDYAAPTTIFGGADVLGAIGVSPDGKYIVVPNGSSIVIAEANYDESGVPTLEKKYTISTSDNYGSRPFDATFDVAGNLYVAYNDNNGGIGIWALPKEENSYTTVATDQVTLVEEEITVSVHANPYASQLAVDPENAQVVSLVLNADAEAVFIELYDSATGEFAGEMNLGAGKAGKNTYWVAPVEAGVGTGDYNWRITCGGHEMIVPQLLVNPIEEEKVQISNARGVAVDNNPDSPYLGRVYVTSPANGNTGALKETGIYVIDSATTDINTKIYNGNVAWSGSSSPYRVSVAPNGDVYVCDWSDSHSGVWVMNPSAPEEDWRAVFGGSHVGSGIFAKDGVNIHGSIPAVFVIGTDEETKLYTLDEDIKIEDNCGMLRYDVGNQTTPWVVAPSATYKTMITEFNNDMAYDGRGGVWISQLAAPYLIHTDMEGKANYSENFFKGTGNCGGFGVSPDGKYIAMPNGSSITVAKVTYSENGVPSLETAWSFTSPAPSLNRPFDAAFDVAGNLYVGYNGTTSSVGGVAIYALPIYAESGVVSRAVSDGAQYVKYGYTAEAKEILHLDVTLTELDGVGVAEQSTVTEYYDVMGRKVLKPEAGKLYIERRGSQVRKVIL